MLTVTCYVPPRLSEIYTLYPERPVYLPTRTALWEVDFLLTRQPVQIGV